MHRQESVRSTVCRLTTARQYFILFVSIKAAWIIVTKLSTCSSSFVVHHPILPLDIFDNCLSLFTDIDEGDITGDTRMIKAELNKYLHYKTLSFIWEGNAGNRD